MNKIYLIIAISAFVLGAYFYGVNITNAKCHAQYLQTNIKNQEQSILKERKIHENVYKTGVSDIRIILRDKYTIAD